MSQTEPGTLLFSNATLIDAVGPRQQLQAVVVALQGHVAPGEGSQDVRIVYFGLLYVPHLRQLRRCDGQVPHCLLVAPCLEVHLSQREVGGHQSKIGLSVSEDHDLGHRHLVYPSLQLFCGSLTLYCALQRRCQVLEVLSEECEVGVVFGVPQLLLADDEHDLGFQVLDEDVFGLLGGDVGVDVGHQDQLLRLVAPLFLYHGTI